MRYFCYQRKFLQKAFKKKKMNILSKGIYEDIESVIIFIGLDCLTGYLIYLLRVIAGFYVEKPLRFNKRVSFHWLSKQHYVNTR